MSTTNILDLNNRIDALEKNSGGGGSADSAKRSDIATEFSATTAYTAGCFVYYEGKLYQFNADHAAGAWDPTDVVEANVTDQIVSNASAIAGLTASDVAYDNTDSGLTATNVQKALDVVAGVMGNVRMIKLWENTSPTSEMESGAAISLSSSDYDYLMVVYRYSKSVATSKSVIVPKGSRIYLDFTTTSFNGCEIYRRNLNYSSDTSYTAENAYEAQGATATTTNNDYIIPTVIYCIKLT